MANPKKVLVTGASGFIGRHLIRVLDASGFEVIGQSRSGQIPTQQIVRNTDEVNFAELHSIIHLAGIAHAGVGDASKQALLKVNVQDTQALYNKALDAQVPSFVWLSSSKVLGDSSTEPLKVDAPYRPGDAYAESKVKAEESLLHAGGERLAIIRPPLVYGAGVKANFLSLLSWASTGWPLPLGRANAPRAWVAVDNLTDLVLKVMNGPRDHCIWHVRDREETSVANMIRRIRSISGRGERLLPIPESVLRLGARLLARNADAERLLAPLRIDIDETCHRLDWQPPISQAHAVGELVAWYQTQS